MTANKFDIADTISEMLVGHCAMESGTNYVVDAINEKYNTDFKETYELVEFAQEQCAAIWECPVCGWYVGYIEYNEKDNREACHECKDWEDD